MTVLLPELEQVRVVVDRETRDRHIAAMRAAMSETASPRFRRRRFLAVAVALILLLPVLTLAARDAVPGDFLYPVKVALDPVTDALGWRAGAESRIGEVEVMVDRRMDNALIREHADLAIDRLVAEERAIEERLALVARLENATDGLEGMGPVRSRLDNLVDELRWAPGKDPAPAGSDHERTSTTSASRDDASSEATSTTRPADDADSRRDRGDRP